MGLLKNIVKKTAHKASTTYRHAESRYEAKKKHVAELQAKDKNKNVKLPDGFVKRGIYYTKGPLAKAEYKEAEKHYKEIGHEVIHVHRIDGFGKSCWVLYTRRAPPKTMVELREAHKNAPVELPHRQPDYRWYPPITDRVNQLRKKGYIVKKMQLEDKNGKKFYAIYIEKAVKVPAKAKTQAKAKKTDKYADMW